jgi:hypothetical protein
MGKSNTLVRCTVAAAIAAAAAVSHATDITTYAQHQYTDHLNVNVFISGSTAIDNTLNAVLNGEFSICQQGTVTEYQAPLKVLLSNSESIAGAIETLWYCQAGNYSGVSTNMYLAIFKESSAGSINGVQPLIAVAKGQQSGLTFLNPTGPDVQAGTCAGPTEVGLCTGSDFLQNVIPTGGVSDVEASLLRAIPGGGTLSASDISNYLVGALGLDIVWGVSVTKNLYYALQTAEGLASKCGGNFDSPTCAPSLSRAQVASLYDRDIVSWTSLGLNNPSGDNTVYICRRSVGSGAEAAFEAYFLGARCGTSSEQMASQDGKTVIASTSTTDGFLWCMRNFDLGGEEITPYNNDFGTTYTPFTPVGNQWAIGIVSTELTPAQITTYGDTLRMVAVDGVLPTLENVVNGYDPFFSTDMWYYITSGDIGSSVDSPAYIVFEQIQSLMGPPIPTADIDPNYANVWGNGGDLSPAPLYAIYANYTSYPVTASELLSPPPSSGFPVNLWTKGSSGMLNNCDTPVLYKGVSDLKSLAESTLLGTGPDVNLGP